MTERDATTQRHQSLIEVTRRNRRCREDHENHEHRLGIAHACERRSPLVFSFIFFDHSAGDTRTFQTPDGRTVTAGPQQPWTWELAEAFQIGHGQIHQIMAIMNHVEYGMNSGWSTWEQGRSSRARYVGQSY